MALRGALTHRKTRRLARLLGYPVACALGVMEALWHVTATHAPTGAIGLLSNQDIADEMFWEGSADELIEHLKAAEILEEHPTWRLLVHGWSEHCDDAINMSLARKGMFFGDGSKPRMGRLSHAERDQAARIYAQSARTETHESAQPATSVRTLCAPPVPVPEPCHAMPEPSTPLPPIEAEPASPGSERASKSVKAKNLEWRPQWQEFLSEYPPRNGDLGRSKGEEKFRAVLISGTAAEVVIDGARRYRAWTDHEQKTGTSFVKQIPTWLNERAWLEAWEIRPRAGPLIRAGLNGGGRQPETMTDKLTVLREQVRERNNAGER